MPTEKDKAQEKEAGHRRTERLDARVTAEQKRLFKQAASLEGRSMTDFMVSAIQQVARRTIREHETMELGDRDREVFVKALLEEREPTEKAKQAANRYLETKE